MTGLPFLTAGKSSKLRELLPGAGPSFNLSNRPARPSFRPSAALGAICGIKLWVLLAALPAAFPFLAQAATQVEPSATKPLVPGQKIAGYKALRFERPYIVQRLTERTYWLAVETNNLIFHVGDRGVLVFDPLSGRRAEIALQAIAKVTDLPVTALVYSHSHLDHIGEAPVFAAAARKNGVNLRIIASQATVDEIKRHGKPVPMPTEVVPIPAGEFVFEDLIVRIFTGGKRHSIDASISHLVQEKVVHAPDFFVPGSLPFENFDFSLDMKGFEDDLEQLIGLDWNFFNDGHGNIGSREDALFMREYIAELRAACLAALGEIPFENFIDPAKHRYVYSLEWVAELAEAAKGKMDPKFTRLEEFDHLFENHVMFMVVNTSLHQSAMVVPQAE